MKKLIAISVMCALVAGAAFADTTVGGAIFIGGAFVKGDNVKGSNPTVQAIDKDAYNSIIKTTFGNNDAGGWFSLHMNGGNANPYHWFAWWRPIPQIRLQIGRNTDGDFGADQIVGWGFTGEAKNSSWVAMNRYSQDVVLNGTSNGFYGGTGGTSNFQLSVFPIDGLSVNLWIPFDSDGSFVGTFAKTNLNVKYNITDIGTVSFAFESNTGYIKGVKATKDDDGEVIDKGTSEKWYGEDGITSPGESPKLYLSFYLSAIENMGVELGLAYKLPFKNPEHKYTNEAFVKKTTEVTTHHPLEIGLGYRLGLGDFQLKLRAAFNLAGSTKGLEDDFTDVKDPLNINVAILPNYKIGIATIHLFAGLGIQSLKGGKELKSGIFKNNESDTVVSWFINPYVRLGTSGGNFLIGFQVYSDGQKYPWYKDEAKQTPDPAKINWAIPFSYYTYF